jgi:hypothetical protein
VEAVTVQVRQLLTETVIHINLTDVSYRLDVVAMVIPAVCAVRFAPLGVAAWGSRAAGTAAAATGTKHHHAAMGLRLYLKLLLGSRLCPSTASWTLQCKLFARTHINTARTNVHPLLHC